MPLDATERSAQNPAVSKPDPEKPPTEAEILPFRAPAKPKPVRTAPGPTEEDSVEPLSGAALVKIGLLILALIFCGVWLMNKLRDIGQLEDCAMQGRRNCVTIEVPDRNR